MYSLYNWPRALNLKVTETRKKDRLKWPTADTVPCRPKAVKIRPQKEADASKEGLDWDLTFTATTSMKRSRKKPENRLNGQIWVTAAGQITRSFDCLALTTWTFIQMFFSAAEKSWAAQDGQSCRAGERTLSRDKDRFNKILLGGFFNHITFLRTIWKLNT